MGHQVGARPSLPTVPTLSALARGTVCLGSVLTWVWDSG